jgi:O-antigen/teichoic acid export membrane protein
VQARVAAGDRDIVARATRTTLLLVALVHVVLAVVSVPLVLVLFGSEFADSIPMIWILLVAGVPLAGGMLLSSVLAADGAPGQTAFAQAGALVVAVPLLLLVVPAHGGMGAAAVSIVSYGASFFVLVRAVLRRKLAPNVRRLILISGGDIAWLRQKIAGHPRVRTMLARR